MVRPAITDERVIGVLSVVVKGSGPVLDALAQTDPFRLKKRTHRQLPPVAPQLDGAKLGNRVARRAVAGFYAAEFPGTAAWERMSPQQRTLWWMNRVGRFTTLVVAVPGFGGVVADRLPVQDALGASSQAMLLCAVAREWGITDQVEQVRLLAWVLCHRSVSRELVLGAPTQTDEQLRAQGLDPALERGNHKSRSSLVNAAKALWRYGRVLRGIVGELEKRPQGRAGHRMLGKLPVVGMVGDYLGERSALKRAVREADRWVRDNPRSLG